MDVRIAARMATVLGLTILGATGLEGEAFAQSYPPGPYSSGPYRVPGPYTAAPPYRVVPLPPLPDDDDDQVPLPAPGPYGRPSNAPYPYDGQQRSPAGIQSEALPPPSSYGRPSGAPYPYDTQQRSPAGIQSEALPPPGVYGTQQRSSAGTQSGALPPSSPPNVGTYPDVGSAPPGARGYSYGMWEPMRPPGEVYGPNDRGLSPGPGGRPFDYGNRDYGRLPVDRPPVETTPSPPGSTGYAALPPDYQPEAGQPKEPPPQFRRQMVDYQTREPAGTIIIDTPHTHLYLVLGGGKAMRYGIGVGREGFTWSGREKISRMSEWPDWHPPKEMIDRQPYLPRFMAGGESNPLGARALYLGNTLYRIHGTNQPSTIGSFVSSGCIRLINADIEDLYGRVTVGTRVVVLPGGKPPETTASVR